MIFFGLMDFFYKKYSTKDKFQHVFFGISLGGVFSMIFYNYILFDGNIFNNNILEYKNIIIGIFLGLLWSIPAISLGISYEKYNANASQMVPIVSSSGFLTAIFGIIFLNEKVFWLNFSISIIAIFLGIVIIANSGIKTIKQKSSINILIFGGGVSCICYGFLNFFFKFFSSISISFLGLMIALTGLIISSIINIKRKQKFLLKKSFILIGFFWSSAVVSLGYGFYPLMGNASTLLPIVSSSIWVTVILSIIFLKESVNLKKIIVGTLLISLGIIFI